MERDVRAELYEKVGRRSRVLVGGVAVFLVAYAVVAGITGGGPGGSPTGLFLATTIACTAAGVATAFLGPTSADAHHPTMWATGWGFVVAVVAWNLLVLLTNGLSTTGLLIIAPLTAAATAIASLLR